MKSNPQTIADDGKEYVIIYSKTRKGKPHPKGGVYVMKIPIEDYKPRNQEVVNLELIIFQYRLENLGVCVTLDVRKNVTSQEWHFCFENFFILLYNMTCA